MEWKIKNSTIREFDKNSAIEGDLYWYHNGKLVFAANTVEDNKKQTLFTKIRIFFRRIMYKMTV